MPTERKPATVGEVLLEEFMRLLGLTSTSFAEASGVERETVEALLDGDGRVSAGFSLILT